MDVGMVTQLRLGEIPTGECTYCTTVTDFNIMKNSVTDIDILINISLSQNYKTYSNKCLLKRNTLMPRYISVLYCGSHINHLYYYSTPL